MKNKLVKFLGAVLFVAIMSVASYCSSKAILTCIWGLSFRFLMDSDKWIRLLVLGVVPIILNLGFLAIFLLFIRRTSTVGYREKVQCFKDILTLALDIAALSTVFALCLSYGNSGFPNWSITKDNDQLQLLVIFSTASLGSMKIAKDLL
ncbi:hypothetical protein HWN39_10620 [Lactobacillus rhamnosus]|uniref:Uncharacterized protein n=1 Tax=Lacticaseibacillus rhamnosus TaxID=47715 RepID=A0A7Y7UKI1_LACRH|nr:hypothetical protein [Lacticaseibacillus rhamnosus]NVO88931.1 hypothetical protein [Lacticaseibacillus rhamnosus]